MLNEQISAHSIVDVIYVAQPILSLLYFIIFLIFGIPFLVKAIARIVILIGFLAIWILDSFVFRFSTFLSPHVPFYLRLILAGAIVV